MSYFFSAFLFHPDVFHKWLPFLCSSVSGVSIARGIVQRLSVMLPNLNQFVDFSLSLKIILSRTYRALGSSQFLPHLLLFMFLSLKSFYSLHNSMEGQAILLQTSTLTMYSCPYLVNPLNCHYFLHILFFQRLAQAISFSLTEVDSFLLPS